MVIWNEQQCGQKLKIHGKQQRGKIYMPISWERKVEKFHWLQLIYIVGTCSPSINNYTIYKFGSLLKIMYKGRNHNTSQITWGPKMHFFTNLGIRLHNFLSCGKFHWHGLLAHKLHPPVSCVFGHKIHKQTLLLSATQ